MCTLEEENTFRHRLIALGPEALAEALLRFHYRHRDVARWVERMASTPDENRQAFHHWLSYFQEKQQYVTLSESVQYARELTDLLEMLEEAEKDPRSGLESLAAFFRADQVLIDQADDSWGDVGRVFSEDGVELFVRYATRCDDKAWVMDLLLELLWNDDGFRDGLAQEARRFLSTDELRLFEKKCRENAEKACDLQRSNWLHFSKMVSVQLEGEAGTQEGHRP